VRSAIHDAVTHQRTAQLVFDQQVIVEYVAEIDGSWTYWYHPEVFGNANAS
jgi:hypothetical protein